MPLSPNIIVPDVVEKPIDIIKPAAIAAYQATVEMEVAEARKAVGSLLGDAVPVDSLKMLGADGKLYVFSDGVTSLAAARVDSGWEIRLVTNVDDGWQRGPLVTSLVELGKALI